MPAVARSGFRPRPASPPGGRAIAVIAALLLAAPAAAQQASIKSAAWIGGCWRLEAKGRVVDEQWMAPAGDVMLGMARTVRDGRLDEYELTLLRQVDGRLDYEAHPVRQPTAVFSSTWVSDTLLIFENPRHDFPKLVAYQKRGADSLIARVAGGNQPSDRAILYPYRRVPCGNAR